MRTNEWVTQSAYKIHKNLLSLPDNAKKISIFVSQLKEKFAPSPRLRLQFDHINTHKASETLHMDLCWDHFNFSLLAKIYI